MVIKFQQPHFYHVVVERAKRSIHQLKCTLGEGEASIGEDALAPSVSASPGQEDTGTAWHELQHSHAGELSVTLPWMTRRELFQSMQWWLQPIPRSTAAILFLRYKSANTVPSLNFFLFDFPMSI